MGAVHNLFDNRIMAGRTGWISEFCFYGHSNCNSSTRKRKSCHILFFITAKHIIYVFLVLSSKADIGTIALKGKFLLAKLRYFFIRICGLLQIHSGYLITYHLSSIQKSQEPLKIDSTYTIHLG